MCHLHLKLCTPAGAAVFRIPAKLLCVLAFEVDQQAERRRTHNAYQPVKGSKAGGEVGKGRDADVLTAAFKEFSAKKLTQEKKPSIRKLLSTLKEAAQGKNAERAKVKNKDREVSL